MIDDDRDSLANGAEAVADALDRLARHATQLDVAPDMLHPADCEPADRLPSAAGRLRGWAYQLRLDAAGLDCVYPDPKDYRGH